MTAPMDTREGLAIGQIVECIEKPDYLSGFSRGYQYVVCKTAEAHGVEYITILGEDDKAHTLLATMFRALPSPELPAGVAPAPETERLMQWITSLLNQIAKLETAALAQSPAKPVARQWIIDLARDQFDPAPSHYKLGDNWDDGAEAIADAILAQLPLLHAEGSVVSSTPRETPDRSQS